MRRALTAVALLFAANANAVVATGQGPSFEAALTHAKVVALEKTSGTMIIHSSETTNDHHSHTTQQYSGGVVVDYKVINIEVHKGLYHVTIDADIKSGKNNIVEGQEPVDQNWLARFQAAQGNALAQRKFVDAFSGLPAFTIKHVNTKVTFLRKEVETRIQFVATWTPKMVSDVRDYAELAQSEPPAQHRVCFAQVPSDWRDPKCFGLTSGIPGIDNVYLVRLQAKVNGKLINRDVGLNDGTLRTTSSRGTTIFQQGSSNGEFIIYTPLEAGPVTDIKLFTTQCARCT